MKCLIFRHKPYRIPSTLYILCERCPKVRKIEGLPGSLASRMVWK